MVDRVCGTNLDDEKKARDKRRKDASIEMPKVGKPFTMAEVESSGKLLVVNGQVLDLSEFKKSHPGGVQVIQDNIGKDCSVEWNMIHAKNTIQVVAPQTVIGYIEG